LIAWRLEVFDELGSTSDTCTAYARAGVAEGAAVLALRQTSGRGSRGRSWQAPEGNLNLSVLLRPKRPIAEAGMFSLLAGVAVAEAVQPLLSAAVNLKWPNDVLLDGRKLAGVLIDAAPAGGLLEWLVIGIGVNLLHAPEIPGRQTTALAAHGVNLSPQKLARRVLEHLAYWQAAPAKAIREAWLAHAHPVGTKLEVSTLHTKLSGHFAGLSERGELLLAYEDRIDAISTGEVLLGHA
jgi:BirA family biotin operon repressor/biotin-[acetyl-CoA-carboxylase] ligase